MASSDATSASRGEFAKSRLYCFPELPIHDVLPTRTTMWYLNLPLLRFDRSLLL